MVASDQKEGRYLLSIEDIPSDGPTFPAYFVGSTAPNNVEDGVGRVKNPQIMIDKMAAFLAGQENPELLITVHGYNTALGHFGENGQAGAGVKGWYQEVRDHIEEECDRRSPGLVLLGYRWPSEEINGGGGDSLGYKIKYAHQSLPVTLRVILTVAIVFAVSFILIVLSSESGFFELFTLTFLGIATFLFSLVVTLFLLRIVGYFRDSYRASNFGVPDLVELIRQIDKAVMAIPLKEGKQRPRIKLSFIGHSMGGFVVTNTVRILSDVFDVQSIGGLNSVASAEDEAKLPSAEIGHVFSLGRLVLASPDIPAETIISGRANFLSSSLRRFEETYLFSNEGDMALKLASTAANYASFPARTREGGYRLGNVVVRSPDAKTRSANTLRYGILNFAKDEAGGELIGVQSKPEGGYEPEKATEGSIDGKLSRVSSFLKYLYILRDKSLSERQQEIIEPDQKPIAELFTVFDCTDYFEPRDNGDGKPPEEVGLLTKALGQPSLDFWNYVGLTIAMARGKIDTHSGYFYSGNGGKKDKRPEAVLTKQLIYGLACLGFQSFVGALSVDGEDAPTRFDLGKLSDLCEKQHIQVLLATERFNRDILKLTPKASDRDGY